MGSSLRPRANALRCRACRVQLPDFSTGSSITALKYSAFLSCDKMVVCIIFPLPEVTSGMNHTIFKNKRILHINQKIIIEIFWDWEQKTACIFMKF